MIKNTIAARRTMGGVLVVFAALLANSPAAHGADRFWIDPLGGGFSLTSNWSATDGGAGGASVPAAADIAKFTLNNTYTVTFSAAVTNTGLDIENGAVTFDLNGNTYTLTNTFGIDIGNQSGQTGRLTVTDGTLATDGNVDTFTVGQVAGGTGFLTVTTAGRIGDGIFRPGLRVGDGGAGTLTVNDNGRIDGSSLLVGSQFGSAGTVTITGPNAVVDISGTTTIGNIGAGTVSVTNGGTLTTTGGVTLGNQLGADGTATVSGVGSSWTMSSTSTIGSSGDGTLTISSGGLVTSGAAVILGSNGTGVGTATVTGTGSRWNVSGVHTIGSIGLGVMTVSSGGEVVSTSSAIIGSNFVGIPSEGRVTITGAGSKWTLGAGLVVARAGTADLTVSAGGEVSATSIDVGFEALGIGEATVTGTGSKLTTTGNVTVASLGNGTLNVSSGAEVYVGGTLQVADPAGAPIGTLNLDGGSIFVAGAFTNNSIFTFTDGLLQVAGNFQRSAGVATMTLNGSDNGDLPTLDLIGAGSTTNLLSLAVGGNRRGQLLLRQGRVLNLGNNTVGIGVDVGGEGTLSVQSGAQLLTTGFLEVGGSLGGAAAGTGTLNVAGGTVDVGTLELFRDGTVNLSSGTLAVDSTPTLDGQFNWTGGTLRFDAAFSLTGTNVPKLLGLDATLDAGQALTSTAAVTLQTPVVVDGGALNASTLINQSRLEVRSGSIGAVQNDGLLLGDGTISGAVTNNAAGRIRVDAGKTLLFSGAFAANAGQLNLQGGTLDFTGAITNSATGFIAGRGALYTGGLTNNGQMAFSGGNSDLHGDVTLTAGSRVVTSGAGSVTTFFDDVVHNGLEIFTGASASTVVFGALSGAGPFTGTGTVYSIGDLRPGNSPATVSYGGSLVLGSSTTLTIELGGTTPGTQHDQVNVIGALALDGTLALSTIGGFVPAVGDRFTIMTYGSRSGTFAGITGQSPAPGIVLSEIYRTNDLILLTTAPGEKTWGVDASGNASVGANWIGGVAPGGIGDAAGFTTIITAPRTVTVDAPLTLGKMRFDDNDNYTLAGPNTITLQHSGANHATINVLNLHGNGQHTIAAPLLVVSDLDIAQNSTGELTLSGGLATTAGRLITKTGAGTLSIAGLQSYGVGTSFGHSGGTLNLLTDAGAGGANLTLTARSTSNFTSTQHLAGLRIAENVVAKLSAGSGKILATRLLSIDTGGQLDLADNDFVLRSTPANRLADAAAIESLIAGGFASFAWNGPGINSSAAAGDPNLLTALGVMLNDNGFGGPYRATFSGEPVDANSVLVKYTYYGDADLSGSVDGTDYALIDNGFNNGLSGWFHGDFDFSGDIDGTDYALIDNAFNNQSGPLSSGPIGPAVPEPGTWALAALGASMIAASRRRRSPTGQ